MTKFYILKPFSPHLLIYSNQFFSSFFSIFHRISSIFLLYFFYILLNLLNFSLNIYFLNIIILFKLFYFTYLFLIFVLFKISFFHLINGLKLIFLNFNYFKKTKILFYLNYLVIILFLINIYL